MRRKDAYARRVHPPLRRTHSARCGAHSHAGGRVRRSVQGILRRCGPTPSPKTHAPCSCNTLGSSRKIRSATSHSSLICSASSKKERSSGGFQVRGCSNSRMMVCGKVVPRPRQCAARVQNEQPCVAHCGAPKHAPHTPLSHLGNAGLVGRLFKHGRQLRLGHAVRPHTDAPAFILKLVDGQLADHATERAWGVGRGWCGGACPLLRRTAPHALPGALECVAHGARIQVCD